MKKMKITAVLVLMMSATSAFADETCAEMWNKYRTAESNIAQSTANIKLLDKRIPEVQIEILEKQRKSKDDSLLIGNSARGFSMDESIQLIKIRANNEASIRIQLGNMEIIKLKYMQQCSSYEKIEEPKSQN